MNTEELTNKASIVLDKLLDAVNTGIDKAPEALTTLAKEYCTYFVIENAPIASTIASVLCFVFMCLAWNWILKEFKKEPGHGDVAMMMALLSAAPFVLSFSMTLSGAKAMLQAHYAPKAFLIENLRGNKK
jgi:hypothetical protein